MRTIRHKSGVIEYVPTIEEMKAKLAEASEVAELARAIRAIAACVTPMMAQATGGGKGPLLPEKFLIEEKLERLEQNIGLINASIRKRLARAEKGRVQG